MVLLSDVIGAELLTKMVQDHVVDPIKKGSSDAPKLVILYGPPGVGKTFVARAIAGELGLELKVINSEETDEEIQGLNFSTTELIFFDEIELFLDSGVLKSLFENSPKDAIFIGGTNHPWKLKDLKFQGNLSAIFMSEPGFETRKGVLSFFLGGNALKVDIEKIADLTKGFTPSEIHTIIKETDVDDLEEIISQTRPTKLSVWVGEVKDNKDDLDPTIYRPLLDWLVDK